MAMLGTMNGVESGAFVPQVVNTLHSWFTPTVLFVLLNIVIGTIAVTSRMRLNNNNPNNNPRRSPSLLSRISSINFSRRTYEEEQPSLVEWSSPEDTETVEDNVVLEQKEVEMEEEKISEVKDIDGRGGAFSTKGLSQRAVQKKNVLGRSKSDSQQLSDPSPPPPPLPGKMHKYGTFEGVNRGRKPPVPVRATPQTVENDAEEESGADAEVNAKADNFINNFKQQLKLQRLESLMRYNDMFGRSK